LRLTPPTEGFPWDDLRKILHGGQRMAKVQNGEEMLPKVKSENPCLQVHTTIRKHSAKYIPPLSPQSPDVCLLSKCIKPTF